MNNPSTTTQDTAFFIRYCSSIQRDRGFRNWCLSNIDNDDEHGTKLITRGSMGFLPLFLDISDEQIEVIHNHFDIDPHLVDDLTIQSMFG